MTDEEAQEARRKRAALDAALIAQCRRAQHAVQHAEALAQARVRSLEDRAHALQNSLDITSKMVAQTAAMIPPSSSEASLLAHHARRFQPPPPDLVRHDAAPAVVHAAQVDQRALPTAIVHRTRSVRRSPWRRFKFWLSSVTNGANLFAARWLRRLLLQGFASLLLRRLSSHGAHLRKLKGTSE